MRIGRELLKGHLPALVMAILAEEPLHGYALCKEIQRRSGNVLKMGEGTLKAGLKNCGILLTSGYLVFKLIL